jgi:hypothetical protein
LTSEKGGPIHAEEGDFHHWVEWSPTSSEAKFEQAAADSSEDEGISLGNAEVTVGGYTKSFEVSSRGEVKVDLVKELNLTHFESLASIECTIKHGQATDPGSFTLDPSEWTQECVQIVKESRVETESNSRLVQLGAAKPGEEFRILHESSDLFKIDYRGKEGYIAKDGCRKVWLASPVR